MSKVYFGFAIADNMFPSNCEVTRWDISVEGARDVIAEGVVPCLNPSHALTIDVMRTRYGINVPIPEKAPVVKLEPGDCILVMGVSGLPRLEGRHEYTPEEVKGAKFRFGLWKVER